MSRRTLDYLTEQLRDATDGLAQELAKAGVSFQRMGPGMPSFFVKD